MIKVSINNEYVAVDFIGFGRCADTTNVIYRTAEGRFGTVGLSGVHDPTHEIPTGTCEPIKIDGVSDDVMHRIAITLRDGAEHHDPEFWRQTLTTTSSYILELIND
jgi:hypothetical protein